MDLIGVNNSIVNMRKGVVRARIHLIRHLSRQVECLRKKKGTEEQKKSNVRKCDRFLQEIAILRRIKKDEASKFALVNDDGGDLKDITINPEKMTADEIQVLLKQRVMLRLANHAVMKQQVQQFRHNNSNWKQELTEVLKVLGEKQKRKEAKIKLKKKLEKKALKQQLELKSESKVENDLKQQEPNSESKEGENDDDELFVSSLKDAIVKQKEAEEEEKMKKKVQEKEEENDDDDYDDDDDDDDDNDDDESFVNSLKGAIAKTPVKMKEKVTKNDEKVEQKMPLLAKKEGTMVIKEIDLNNEESSEEEEEEGDEETKPLEQKEALKSSFFLGGQSSESEPESESEANVKDEEAVEQKQGRGFDNNRGRSSNRGFDNRGRGSFRGRSSDRGFDNRGRGNFRGRSSDRGFDNRGRGNFRGRSSDRGFDNRGRGNFNRGRSSDRGFDNRGRGFGDNTGRGNFRGRGFSDNRGRGFNDNRGRGSFGGRGFDDNRGRGAFNDDLHPSWAAKRNSRTAIITDFQGKRTKFDQGGEDSKTHSSSQLDSKPIKAAAPHLHPSWAAKKEKSGVIKEFKGTKVVFDDD